MVVNLDLCIDPEQLKNILQKEPSSSYTYSNLAMDCSPSVEILNVWKWAHDTLGTELKYTEGAMELAKTPEILEWWFNSGLPLKYDRSGKFKMYIDEATCDVWRRYYPEVRFTPNFGMKELFDSLRGKF